MRNSSRSILAAVLAALLCAPAQAQTGDIVVVVKDGEGAVHNIRRRAVSPVMVEVRDERNKPVADAKVRFTLPEIGPGGRFIDGSRTLEAFTDSEGRAGFSSFVLNEQEGRFSIAVQAVAWGREANTAIGQMNTMFQTPKAGYDVSEPRARRGRGLALILGVGAAATIGGVLASRGGGGAGAPPVSVGVGGVGVGGPR